MDQANPLPEPGRDRVGVAELGPTTPNSTSTADPSSTGESPPSPPPGSTRSRPRATWGHRVVPAWAVSVLVHAGILGALAASTLTPQVREAVALLDTTLVEPRSDGAEAELVPILGDPADMPRTEAAGTAMPTLSQGIGGGGPPSATPSVGVGSGSAASAVGERSSLPSIRIVPQLSGLAMLPASPGRDLGGLIGGDVTFPSEGIGPALDQVAREILHHLEDHKVIVAWLFDESASMEDDQKSIKENFARISTDLKLHAEPDRRSADALTHTIVGFGKEVHFQINTPTTDIDAIGRGIDALKVDKSGEENVLHALRAVIEHHNRWISKDRRLLIVLNTDESGDDGSYVEEARQLAVSRGVSVYVIGRQSLFGYDEVRIPYKDPETKDTYWPTIRRGPETAGAEILQWDGLHRRWDEQPSGFGPYELARLAKQTNGIYFLLPSVESLRLKKREAAYSIATLKEYVPDYESRQAYLEKRQASDLRRTLFEVIQATDPEGGNKELFQVRRHFPLEPGPLVEAATEAGQQATIRLNGLIEVEKRLRKLQSSRDREPEKRWQASYDLMLAQVVAYQVKAYEYRACMKELVGLVQAGKPPVPRRKPGPTLNVNWEINHSRDRKAPDAETKAKYAEAERLLKRVGELHPNTPWADLARDELNRGLGVKRDEWYRSPRYEERQKLVPKF